MLVLMLWANHDLTTKCSCNCLLCRTQALDESSSLEMLPDRLRTEIAIHVHLDTLRKVWASTFNFVLWVAVVYSLMENFSIEDQGEHKYDMWEQVPLSQRLLSKHLVAQLGPVCSNVG